MSNSDLSTNEAFARLSSVETDPHALDRRRFLQLIGMGVGAGLIGTGTGSLLDHVLSGHDPSAWALGPVGAHDGILVVIGMNGGNDGLNTIVPITNGLYYDQRGSVAIAPSATLPLTSTLGLHPALATVKSLWDNNQVAIVDGIGYPDPDFSHFNSMAYWMSAQPNSVPTSGWLGRWLDGYLGGAKDLYAAAEIGTTVPLQLQGQHQRGTAVPRHQPTFGATTEPGAQRVYNTIRAMHTNAVGPLHEAVGEAFVDQLDLAKALNPVIPPALPDPPIVASLEVAARLINANLGFRVLTTSWGDFDSHAGQPAMHNARMADLDRAIARFFEILGPAWLDRVTIMTMSEFGRTPWSNDGIGTDHGSAAPHLVIGRNVRGGLYGQTPSLAGLGRWDRMSHHVDFRSYYASIIDGWLGGGSRDVLDADFETLGLFAAGPGGSPPQSGNFPPATTTVPSRFMPLTPARIADTRNGTGGVPIRPIQAGERMRIKVTGVGGVPVFGATAVVTNVTAVEATSPMYFTVFPGSTAQPHTSSLNGGPGRPVPNLAVSRIGDDGYIEVFNSHGTTHCIVDVFGYFSTKTGARFTPLSPARVFDTRIGVGAPAGKLRHGQPIDVDIAGRAGVPPSGATAVVLNLTATETESPGWLRMAPSGVAATETSNVNFFAGDTVPNLVICKLGANGKVSVDSAGLGTHALADVFGYFGSDGTSLQAVPPTRVLDTRIGLGSPQSPAIPGAALRVAIAGTASVPGHARAVVLNVTATNVPAHSYVTVWPSGEPDPGTSNLNLAPGSTIANLVICRLGSDGALSMGNPLAACDLIADVVGFFVD